MELYRRVYGRGYALPLGTDPQVMAREIASANTTWLVAHDSSRRLIASIVATTSPGDRLAKMQGLVVDPASRGSGIAQEAVSSLSDLLLADGTVDSVYATARTTATAPQRICLRSGFRALGIFPNLRKAAKHETMVLLARHQDGVLDRRHPVDRVPAGLGPIVEALDTVAGLPARPELVPDEVPEPRSEFASTDEIELIGAERFVLRRFDEMVTDPSRRFYPFHKPDVMLAGPDGLYEVYAHLSRADGYCTLIGAAPDARVVSRHLDQIIARLNDFGAFYIETLVPLYAFDELSSLLSFGFLPAAVYPAMRRDGELFHDYVVMARTMQPLDFRGLAIDAAFRPFTEQYIALWTQMYLNTHGVFR
ncbi:GNAT family N-acetyltransferase [Amycolatopsis antarctica]|uniref:GNAT family N-acetyltransferase n=2 Tax=Amycolatopsis antarctica TaxID=1854586 RepID=A0A263D7U8_9PSEU|nr:GNAT family N-acetyltransferase [Amycolatopsis antarctica]